MCSQWPPPTWVFAREETSQWQWFCKYWEQIWWPLSASVMLSQCACIVYNLEQHNQCKQVTLYWALPVPTLFIFVSSKIHATTRPSRWCHIWYMIHTMTDIQIRSDKEGLRHHTVSYHQVTLPFFLYFLASFLFFILHPYFPCILLSSVRFCFFTFIWPTYFLRSH
jgi:hypothetical protein